MREKEANNTLVDVGAHQGFFSQAFAQAQWHVVAFEPERLNLKALREKMQEFERVVIIPKAVSDSESSAQPFYVSEEHFGIHSLKPFHSTHEFAYEVETVRLDTTLASLDINNVSLLKIDVEGADFLVLKSFDFNRYKPALIMVEFMDDRSFANFGYTHHEVVRFMKDKGYCTFVSEWNPIKEYGREKEDSEPHVWVQCAPYPLNHEPAWGNLIFVPQENRNRFIKTLDHYLSSLEFAKKTLWLRQVIKKIPGAATVHRQMTYS